MKINKVLLGLFAGVLTLIGGTAKAQFYEIGPANIGGEVSSMIVDRQDSTNQTIYAGAISGGLYVRSSSKEVLDKLYADMSDRDRAEKLANDKVSWHLVRFIDATGQEYTLPISAMTQAPDGSLILGTGDDRLPVGTNYAPMSVKGRGIYRYNPADGSFTMLPYTNPANSNRFNAVHALEGYVDGNTYYLFAATNSGLYRWSMTVNGDDSEWNSNARLVQAGNIDQLIIVRQLKMAYFSIGSHLYRIGNITKADNEISSIDITKANPAFGREGGALKLASAPTNPSYLYVMVIEPTGVMKNIYLSTNGQNWTPLATSSVIPFLYSTRRNDDGTIDTIVSNSGLQCGTICVDPTNEKRIIISGSNIWVGQGYLEGGTFTWTKRSYSEVELNGGDYMSNVFNTSIFVHSGIHKMIPVFQNADTIPTYYIATNGGIYSSQQLYTFNNLNRGLNNVQINSIAVSPDGSVISGANNNACPFIESRMAHNGGTPLTAWYDDGTLGNMNHDANIIWHGNGGKVAASSFQQIKVQPHRNIFVSSANGSIGRAYTDYTNFTNTQTWTTGKAFLANEVYGGPTIGNINLWENVDDHYYRDSVKVGLDMRGFLVRAGGDTLYFTLKDKDGKDSIVNRNYLIKAGDHATFLSKANSDYPFEHYFSGSDVNKLVTDSFYVKSQIVSRMLAVVSVSATQTSVIYSWTANDFSKIYDSIVDNDRNLDPNVKSELREKFMWWAPIHTVSRNSILNTTNLFTRDAVMSPDGRYTFISTYDTAENRSQLYRISGFENVNFSATPNEIRRQINAASDAASRVLRTTRFSRGTGINKKDWFDRPISSITVDQRNGADRVLLTYDSYSSNYANFAIIEDASTDNWTVVQNAVNGNPDIPAFCSMVEDSTGDIYVGTSDGVYIFNGTSWRQYEHLRGVPVTSIVQQTNAYPVRRATNHTGITENKYLFAKTKWPRAIYFGTYGRGIFMDMTYVTDTENEISDSADYTPVSIPTVEGNGENRVSIYPNPVMGDAHLSIEVAEAGNAYLRIYDLNGRTVVSRNLGHVSEGEQTFTFSTDELNKGMYLINVIIGGHTSATKMVVR